MKLATRMTHIHSSEIRELLKAASNPDIISFAGGLPAPELFPTEMLADIMHDLLTEKGQTWLQYGTTAGHAPLREAIAQRLRSQGILMAEAENILITNGSQQGLDLAGKLFLDKGSVLLCESPTYLAALHAFRAYEPRIRSVPTDAHGMIPEELERVLMEEPDTRLVYVIPDFQNPTGISWSHERRKAFMRVMQKTQIPVLEDNPYGELRFEGSTPPSLQSMDTHRQVLGLGTFSKILCPGLRIGWIHATPALFHRFEQLKQGTDLHTSHLNQACIAQWLSSGESEKHLATLKRTYQVRRDLMITALRKYFPLLSLPSPPEGGLFLWLSFEEEMDSRVLLEHSLKNGVIFVPGSTFFPEGGHHNTLRLNFSNTSEDQIPEGIHRIRNAYDMTNHSSASQRLQSSFKG